MVQSIGSTEFHNLTATAQRQVVLGYTIEVIEAFKHNPDIRPFLLNTFAFEYRDYVFKSKTLVISRVIRDLEKSLDSQKFSNIKVWELLTSFLENSKSTALLYPEASHTEKDQQPRHKTNSNDKLNKWLQGL